ncbi:hypothetical protein [Algicella marina]|uniref:Polysaccharide biosynthesis protein C-terminal domain-containing protein n=1 Tax=Algicella marina TaxID=2683284 RepID=A0A6P1T759_9RHOB|nr:hypothetical protein [Algicella marina]QHQ36412.1 hypothetical protein GO499_15130 [Algicella marina]
MSVAAEARALVGVPALLVAARLGGAICGMLFLLLLTRTGGAALAGEVAALIAATMLLGLAGTANIEAGGVRFMVRALATGQPEQATGFIRFSRRLTLVLACCITAGVWICTTPGAAGTLALLAVPLIALARLGAGLAMGFSRVLAGIVPRTFLRQALMLAGLALLTASLGPPDLWQVMALWLAANAVVVTTQSVALRRHRVRLTAAPDTTHAPAWVRHGLTLGLNVLYIEYAIQLTIVLAATVLAPADLARLDICLKIAAFLRFAAIAVNQAFMPRLSAALATADAPALARWLALASLLRLAAVGTGFGVLAVTAPHLLRLFGPEFAPLAPLLLALALEPLIAALFGPAATMLTLSSRPTTVLPVLAATLATLALGTLLGGHLFGLWGVAAAWLAAALLWSAALAHRAQAQLGIDTTVAATARWCRTRVPMPETTP